MPEGDTIFRAATVLRRALAGRVVTGFDLVAPKVTTAAAKRRIVGGTVKSVGANGKHLLITFGTDGEDVVLHTHMKMTGMWHVYRAGERWRFAPSKARVVIRTDEYVAPCVTPPIVELLTAHEVALHPILSALGPDILADDFDGDAALRRLRADGERDVATALLEQRNISGIGNEFKCEVLFLTRVWPWTKTADVDDATLRRIVALSRELMLKNLDGGPRRTRFALNPRELVWVMERTGLPCYVCGTAIAWGNHPNEFRKSWYCPRCQGPIA
ncbi:MAG TPA: DNA-formamidopyrimidine glycosylase family protein [Candidatus Limnocylindria bacterium]|nr:DNA-formamidopyrimidine glycosylase family protein [Candidatus Limnocylindria bacterium]